MNRLLYIFIALAVSALIAVSCSSSKEAGMPSVTSGEDLSVRGARELASALAEPGDWQTMKIPVNVVLRKPVSVRLGGNMTLVRGKEIRVSLRFLGFEVAAASITGDSVKAYVKMQKIYLSESLSALLGGFPATVDNVQSLLLARIFQVGQTIPDLRVCRVEAGDGFYTVMPPVAAKGMEYRFKAMTDGNLLDRLEITHTGGHSARVSYDYPHDVSGGIPSEVALSGSLKGRSVEAYLEYSAGKADRDAGMPGAFSIPRGYRKVSASSLIKLLDSLK